jgi:2-polyprenyl-3-methyl-5-hydroxy-6-metoxy-1,4-benzoquinol methylase
MKNSIIEQFDKKLFNEISEHYSRKDIYKPSRIARQHQINCIISHVKNNAESINNLKIIEVGCGHGANSQYLNSFYSNYLGIDYSDELIRIANHRYSNNNTSFLCSNIKDYNTSEKYDLIIGVGILHHVDDLLSVLNSIRKFGNPNSFFVFLEPQKENVIVQLLRKFRKNIDKKYSENQIYFSKKELSSVFYNAGFIDITTRYQGYLTPPFAQIILTPNVLFKPLAKIAVWIDDQLFRHVNSKFAWNIILSAKIKN